jgi:CDP-diacylglycerol--glycerol-3-phosphate 3-phosphatidyltransferase
VIPGVSTALMGTIALWVAAILTLWSMFHYLKLAAPHIAGPHN